MDLDEVLARSRQLGFLGPGPVADQIVHADRYRLALAGLADLSDSGRRTNVVDLGAGGGVPSLPLLVADPDLSLVLVDSSQRRMAFCLWAMVELGVDDRAEVWTGRAEDFGRDETRRGHHDAVIARSFGPPAVTIECAAPLLRVGGRCVISEPPQERAWPAGPLAQVGLVQIEGGDGVAVFEQTSEVGPEFPRSGKRQRRQPLF